jgi:hypothetical protein
VIGHLLNPVAVWSALLAALTSLAAKPTRFPAVLANELMRPDTAWPSVSCARVGLGVICTRFSTSRLLMRG